MSMIARKEDFKILWGMAIDLDKCTGCGACMVACQAENNIAPVSEASDKRRALNWLTVYELSNGESFPHHDLAYLPRPCQQCGTYPCASVCPVTATDKNEEGGIVSQIHPRCIGCRYCMAACPYHARYFNWSDPVWPRGLEKTITPDVSVRPRGVVEKCSFCHHRFMQAKDKARLQERDIYQLREEEYTTACAESCPSRAITFGDLKNPGHKVYALARHEHAFRLLARLGTEPQVYYLSARAWVRRQGENYRPGEELLNSRILDR